MEKKPTKEAVQAVDRLQLELKQVVRTKSVLNENQVQKIFNSTPAKYKYRRPGRGGGQWDYVRAGYVRQVLDSIFGFNWDFVIETPVEEALQVAQATKSVVLKGYIVGRVLDEKLGLIAEIKKGDFGRAEVKFRQGSTELLDFGNDLKAAASDCLKRCAARFGIAADVYDPQEFRDIEIVGSDEASERKKNVEKQVADAKKVIEAQSDKVGGENGQR